MRKQALILALALTACTAKAPLSVEIARSEIARNPEASYIDGRNGSLKWNYTTGLELKALLDADITNLSYVEAWYDAIIDSTGSIYKYKKENYSLDHVCPARTLFNLHNLSGKEKYRLAMDRIYEQLKEQPRTPEGGFWHKAIYPGQMWLDGLYMAQPFYAEYTNRYVPQEQKEENYADIAHQFTLAFEKTYDPATGLLRHAWDSSRSMFWCNPENGQSAHAWGRAMGWYTMALADVIEILPQNCYRDSLCTIFNKVWDVLPQYRDSVSGMWFQVLDRPYAEGNYLESSCSAMFVYSMLKGLRLGVLDGIGKEEAAEAFSSLIKTFVRKGEDSLWNLDFCCEVAGLGGKNKRSGDYAYYIGEPVCSNDPKGTGPLIWAALEYERL